MEAKELMIGDWVWYNKQPHQIRQLGIFGENRDGDDYPAVCVGKPNGIGLILERNEIEPIPLTPEILEKNGFEPYIAGQMLLNKSEDFIVTVLPDLSIYPNSEHRCLVGIRNGYTNAKIALDYLHELQNALRICGINEEIER